MVTTVVVLGAILLAAAVPGDIEPRDRGGRSGPEVGAATPAELDARFGEGEVLDGTGHLLPRGGWQVGLVETKVGLLDGLEIGTSVYPWLLAPMLFQGFSANVGVKGGIQLGPLLASLEARYLYLDVEETDDDGPERTEDRVSAHVLPLTAALTFRPAPGQDYSFAARYVNIEASGDRSRETRELIDGAAAADAVHLIFSGRWRISKVLGIYARAYFEPWASNLEVDGESRPRPDVRVRVRASLDPNEDADPKWSALAGAHLHLGDVNLRLGAGYGSYFLPAVGVVLPDERLFPDIDIYVRL